MVKIQYVGKIQYAAIWLASISWLLWRHPMMTPLSINCKMPPRLPDDIVCFTDGSRLQRFGWSGAGVFNQTLSSETIIPLGKYSSLQFFRLRCVQSSHVLTHFILSMINQSSYAQTARQHWKHCSLRRLLLDSLLIQLQFLKNFLFLIVSDYFEYRDIQESTAMKCHTGILLWFYRTRASNRYNCNYGLLWNKFK